MRASINDFLFACFFDQQKVVAVIINCSIVSELIACFTKYGLGENQYLLSQRAIGTWKIF